MDRNSNYGRIYNVSIKSLSARRAWIEIFSYVGVMGSAITSLSARRAWIEICLPIELSRERGGRSPQGERG